jgi:hypothetical protein
MIIATLEKQIPDGKTGFQFFYVYLTLFSQINKG